MDSGEGDGPTRMLGSIAFSLGLILVVVGGAELFTGKILIVLAWADGKVGLRPGDSAIPEYKYRAVRIEQKKSRPEGNNTPLIKAMLPIRRGFPRLAGLRHLYKVNAL